MKRICAIILTVFTSHFVFSQEISFISKSEGPYNGHLTTRDLSKLQRVFNVTSFIETGTYGGETTKAASYVFNQVHSIEIYPSFFYHSQKLLQGLPNIYLYLGDTCEILEKITRNTPLNRMYWLDAHYCGENTGGIPGFFPVPTELGIIQSFGSNNDVILVDDIRGIFQDGPKSLISFSKIVKNVNPFYQTYFLGDMALIYDKNIHSSVEVSSIVKACTNARLHDYSQETPDSCYALLEYERIIASIDSQTDEGRKFMRYGNWFDNEAVNDGSLFFIYWNGLIYLEQNKLTQAITSLQKVVGTLFFSHWHHYANLAKAFYLSDKKEDAHKIYHDHLKNLHAEYVPMLSSILSDDIFHVLSSDNYDYIYR